LPPGFTAEAVVAEIDAARAEDKTIGQAAAFALDVGDRSAIQSVVQATSDRFGGIDIIINNAGFSRRMEIEDPDFDATWAKALEVMLSAHQHIIRAALPHLQRRLQAEPGGPSPQR
jgi:3-oxoacyl-[acyl-carrier protein] reductase